MEVKRLVNQKANETNSWLLSVKIRCNENTLKQLKHLHPEIEKTINDSELCDILQVASVELIKASDLSTEFDVEILKVEAPLCPRCRRHIVAQENDICQRCYNVLKLQK